MIALNVSVKLARVATIRTIFIKAQRKSWKQLSVDEQRAWQQLGWSESQWDGKTSPPHLAKWKDLSAEQYAAARHGLHLTESDYESGRQELSNVALINARKAATVIKSTEKGSVLGLKSAAKVAFSALRSTAPAVNALKAWMPSRNSSAVGALELFDAAFVMMDNFTDRIPLLPGTVRTVLYLDDSGSMTGANIAQAHNMLSELAPLLPQQLRIVKFGTKKSLLYRGDEAWSASWVQAGWVGSSGGTFMWEMIKDDILSSFHPRSSNSSSSNSETGAGKLRVIIITDGYDTHSHGEYNGIDGMHPMMRDLKAAGFNVEFQIIIVGKLSSTVTKKYQELAAATNGNILSIPMNDLKVKSEEVQRYLKRIERKKQQELEKLPDGKN